jgi:hypothetical protein
VQVEGQFIPAGLLVTAPVPETETVNWKFWGGGGFVLPELPPQAASINRDTNAAIERSGRTVNRRLTVI